VKPYVKSALLSLTLLAGTAVAAHAQSGNVAALPPNPAPATAPSYGTYPGPNPGSSWSGVGQQTQAVTPSPAYVGPSPGAGTGQMPPHYDKSADWDANTALHPYTSNVGPRPH
jgi:hypothetical protein